MSAQNKFQDARRSILLLAATLGLTVVALAPKANAADAGPSTATASSSAEAKIPFHAADGELTTLITAYARASGKEFIVDPGVKGKIGLYTPGDVSLEEAYNILCEALALNGYTAIEEGNTVIVKSARNAQRDMVPTVTQVPPPKPNRMFTLVYKLKYVAADEINRRLRVLPSKDGEMSPFEPSNSLIISDYATNLNRIASIIELLDTPQAGKWKAPPPPKHDSSKVALPKTKPDADQ